MKLLLHCFGESGHSYKVALPMTLAGMDWRPVMVDFFRGESRGDTYRQLNPMGEAPVLETGDMTLSQSGAIQDWISEETGLFGGGAQRREVLRWVLWDNHKLSSVAGSARFMMNFLPEERRSQPVIDWHIARLKGALEILDGHLDGRDWIVGKGPTNADFSCCSYLFYEEPFGYDRHIWPNIARWLGNIASLEKWAHPYDLMPRAFPGT